MTVLREKRVILEWNKPEGPTRDLNVFFFGLSFLDLRMALLPQVSGFSEWKGSGKAWWTEKTLSTASARESIFGSHAGVSGSPGGDGVGGGVCGRRGGGVGGHWVWVRRAAGGARAAVSGAAGGWAGAAGAGDGVCGGPDCGAAGGGGGQVWEYRGVADECDAICAEYFWQTVVVGAFFSVSGPAL